MAMGRPRSRSRAGWPDNLYPSSRGGFRYRHPATKRDHWMGTDKAKAFAAARKLNAILLASNDLVSKVAGAAHTVADALKVFRDDDVPQRPWGEKTAAWYGVYIDRIEADLGDRDLEGLTVKDCAEYIRGVTESARSRQTYRLVLGWILACAVQEGWIDTNPAEMTRKFGHTRKRQRLTIEVYSAVWAQASAWLRNAMDISLLTLLRREDVAALRFADYHDGALWVVPAKTEGSTNVRLRIDVGPELASVLSRARDDVVSTHIIHRLPEKARPSHMRAKDRTHHTQVLPEQLTRAFAAARDLAAKAAPDLIGDNPPTFHEIRSLGGALLQQEAGWSLQQVQALMGHASEEMTRVYLEGHERPWQQVATGIQLPQRGAGGTASDAIVE